MRSDGWADQGEGTQLLLPSRDTPRDGCASFGISPAENAQPSREIDMTRLPTFARTLVACSVLLGGCDDSGGSSRPKPGDVDGDHTADAVNQDHSSYDDDFSGDDDISDDAEDEDLAPPPFSRPFEELEANEALWATFKVAIASARVERGMDAYWEENDGWSIGHIDPKQVYAELDLVVTNLTVFDNALASRKTWDLILPDGSRIAPKTTFSASLSPLSSSSYTLRYPVDEAFTFAGAQLELNGVERGVFHPERIPLDAPYKPDIDVMLDELVGKVFESTRPDDDGRERVKILSARVSRNSPVEDRAPYGKLFVDLEVDVTAIDRGGARVVHDDFRLDLDDRSYPPENSFLKDYDEGAGGTHLVTFVIPDSAREFGLRFHVGATYERGPEWQSVNVTFTP